MEEWKLLARVIWASSFGCSSMERLPPGYRHIPILPVLSSAQKGQAISWTVQQKDTGSGILTDVFVSRVRRWPVQRSIPFFLSFGTKRASMRYITCRKTERHSCHRQPLVMYTCASINRSGKILSRVEGGQERGADGRTYPGSGTVVGNSRPGRLSWRAK